MILYLYSSLFSFFFTAPAPTEIYTLSLHDALPISARGSRCDAPPRPRHGWRRSPDRPARGDRKSTRLNSSHVAISYAVFCLKKKRKSTIITRNEQNTFLVRRLIILMNMNISNLDIY